MYLRKQLILLVCGLLAVAVATELAFGHSSQPQASKSGAPGENNCTQCHSGTVNSGSGNVSIVFNGGGTTYVQGTTYPITVTVSDPISNEFGFQITALTGGTGPTRGTFALINTTITSMQSGNVGGSARSYVGHKTSNSTSTWTFNWTAPTNISSPITFYASGNAVNSNNSTSGDRVYTTTLTINMAPPPPPVALIQATPSTICQGGQVSFSDASTGTVSSRSWSFPGGNPSTATTASQSVTYANPGTYTATLIVVNAGGSDTITQNITVNPNPVLSGAPYAPLCVNSITGGIDLTVTGTSINTYAWSNLSFSQDLSNVAPGTYTVTVTANTSCTSTATYTVPNAPALGGNTSTTAAGCTVPNGTATVSGTGGAGGFSYLWSNNQTTATATGLAAGTHTVTITDANGCTAVQTVTVPTTAAPTATTSTTAAGCTVPNGTATVTAAGGTGGYTYLWPDNQTTATATGLASGSYDVTVTDANGCTTVATAIVLTTMPPVATASSTPSDCGIATGTATASALGGTGTLAYLWSNGDTTPTATALPAGSFTVTVTDANGCTTTATTTVSNTNAPSIAGIPTLPSCPGASDGIIGLAITGAAPFTYAWSNGDTTATITGIIAGTYTVSVTDTAGCIGVETITLSDPTPVLPNATAIPSNTLPPNGSVQSTATGGNPPYTYLWSTGATTASVNGLAAGIYTVTVTDANGCTALESVEVIQLVGIDEPEAGIMAYPVPFGSSLVVETGPWAGMEAELRIEDIQGRTVWSSKHSAMATRISLETAQIPAGSYLLRIQGASGQSVKRIYKVR